MTDDTLRAALGNELKAIRDTSTDRASRQLAESLLAALARPPAEDVGTIFKRLGEVAGSDPADAYYRGYNLGYDEALEHYSVDASTGKRKPTAEALDVKRLTEALEVHLSGGCDPQECVPMIAAEYARLAAKETE